MVGFRKPSGQLTTTQTFQTIQLPRLVRGKPGAWDPSVCFKWGEDFIHFLKSVVSESMPDASPAPSHVPAEEREVLRTTSVGVWRVKFTPATGVSVVRLDQDGVVEVEAGEERIGFLPRWYLNDLASSTDPASSRTTNASRTDSQFTSSSRVEQKNDVDAVPPSAVPAGWNI